MFLRSVLGEVRPEPLHEVMCRWVLGWLYEVWYYVSGVAYVVGDVDVCAFHHQCRLDIAVITYILF
jgi:hypothetical protein